MFGKRERSCTDTTVKYLHRIFQGRSISPAYAGLIIFSRTLNGNPNVMAHAKLSYVL